MDTNEGKFTTIILKEENNFREPEAVQTAEKPKISILRCIKNILKAITVEPIVLLLLTPRLICALALDNLLLEKACLVNLGLNETLCQAMVVRNRSGYAPEDEIAVQQVVSKMLSYKAASHVFQIFLILLVGSWSDRTGRRRSMFVVPYVGDISALLGYIVCVYFFMELGAEYTIFLEALFSVALGGIPLLMAGVYSYVAAITDSKSRTVRIGVVSMVLRFSLTIGISASGFLYKYLGFYGTFLSALCMNLVGFIYIFIIVKNVKPIESIEVKEKKENPCRIIWNSVCGSITDSLKVCFKSGPNRRRTTMILLQAINVLSFGIMTGEGTVLYLFSRKQLGWDEVNFSIFKGYRTIVELSGCAFVLAFLSKYRRWNDVDISILACLSRVLGTIIMAFGKTGALLYVGTLIDSFNGATIIAVRSMITKTVQPNEQALTNSLTGLLDSFGTFLIGSLYAYVYYLTVGYLPGSFFLVSSLFYVVIFLMLLMVRKILFGKNNLEVEIENKETTLHTAS